MPTIRIATDCTLPPARVLRAAYNFGPDRTLVWPAVRAEHLTVHELSDTTADATEGTPAGIGINWERCHYDWSQPGRVTATVTGSNVYVHPGSSWQLTATPSKRGSRVEMVWQRTFCRNPRGLFFGRGGLADLRVQLLRHPVPDRRPPDLRPLRAAGHRQPRGART